MNTQISTPSYQISYEVMQQLSEQITENDGRIDTEIYEGDTLICFEGWYNVESTTENDYYNGTGASYFSYASVSLSCTVYDEEGDEIINDYTDKEFEKYLLN